MLLEFGHRRVDVGIWMLEFGHRRVDDGGRRVDDGGLVLLASFFVEIVYVYVSWLLLCSKARFQFLSSRYSHLRSILLSANFCAA